MKEEEEEDVERPQSAAPKLRMIGDYGQERSVAAHGAPARLQDDTAAENGNDRSPSLQRPKSALGRLASSPHTYRTFARASPLSTARSSVEGGAATDDEIGIYGTSPKSTRPHLAVQQSFTIGFARSADSSIQPWSQVSSADAATKRQNASTMSNVARASKKRPMTVQLPLSSSGTMAQRYRRTKCANNTFRR